MNYERGVKAKIENLIVILRKKNKAKYITIPDWRSTTKLQYSQQYGTDTNIDTA